MAGYYEVNPADIAKPTSDFVTVRYNANGTPDPTFGTNGVVSTRFGSVIAHAQAVALQPDGKIVVAGYYEVNPDDVPSPQSDFALARYNTNGTLDILFGPLQ